MPLAPPRTRLRAALLRLAPGARLTPPRWLSEVASMRTSDASPHDARDAFPLAALAHRSPHPRLLVVRPDHLGDVLLAGPALARLRQALPDAHVTILVGPWSRDVAALLPGAEAVDALPFPAFARGGRQGFFARYRPLLAGARRLRAARYDAALLLRDDDWWSAWLTALAGIPVRIGHDHPACRPFLTHALRRADAALDVAPHVAAASLDLVGAALGAPFDDAEPATPASGPVPASGPAPTPPDAPFRWPLALRLDDAARRAADALLGPAADLQPIAVHAGSGSPIKRWRSTAWAEVLRALLGDDLARGNVPIVLTGGPGEAALTASIARCLPRPAIDLAGQTGVAELAAVFARCRLVMGPDSGPLHLAVAVGTPTVHLYGPADARRFGPWGPAARHAVVGSDLPCAPCGRLDWPNPEDHPCVRLIAPGEVIVAAQAVLAAP